MSISESQARLAVRDLEDLVGLVPFLIGFHPASSLVILVIDGSQVAVTARIDLAAVDEPSGLIGLVTRLFERFPAAEAWFLAYTDDGEQAWSVLECCAELAGMVRLGRLVQVHGQTWRADYANGPTGQVVTSPAAAQAVVLGLPVRASREELARQVEGPSDAQIDALLAEFEQAAAHIDRLGLEARRRLLQQLCAAPEGVRDYVRLAVLVAEPDAQVAVLRGLDQGGAAAAVALWTAVIHHCLVPYVTGPLGLLGVASWLTGDGAMQTVCLERLDRIDPLNPLAALLDWINAAVLPPAQWAHYRGAMVGALSDQSRLLPP